MKCKKVYVDTEAERERINKLRVDDPVDMVIKGMDLGNLYHEARMCILRF